jgi:D-xylose transport system substrate-binding protein
MRTRRFHRPGTDISILTARRWWRWMAMSICVGTFFIGCTNGTSNGNQQEGPITIGFSVATDTFVIERWNKDVKIFTSSAAELGAQVIFQLSAGGAAAQINQIRYLLDQNIDVLVVLPHDMELLSGVIRQANDRRIPVIAYDRIIRDVPISAYVSFDNAEVGRLFGRALTRQVPRGNYIILNGSVRDNNSYLVNQGLYEVLQPFLDRGDINLVEEIWLEEWSADEATARLRPVLARSTNIQAISAANDQLANAAINLLSELRIAGEVAVVGQDADLLSAQRIVEGLQLMTVYKPIGRLAARAAYLAVALAKGNPPPPDRFMENGSDQPIPFYMEIPLSVTRENIDDTIIRDGFHSAADVYRTVAD